MFSPKEILIATIKEWIEINNELIKIQKIMKEQRLKKKQLTDALVGIMKNNEIDCFDITDGKLLCKTTKTKAPINRETLIKSLEDYFVDNPTIDTLDVGNFILDKRVIKETSSLVIKSNK